jgi:Flp pilus assembly protein TadD
LENSGDLDGAIDEINKASKVSERSFMANFTKGRLLFQKGKFDSCIAPLKQARALNPENLDVVSLLAQAAMRQNLSDAPGYYVILLRSERFKNRPEPWNELGVYYANHKDFKRASQFLVKAESLAPESPQIAFNLAVLNDSGLNRPAEAVSYYKKYLRQTVKNPELEAKRKLVADRVRELSGS